MNGEYQTPPPPHNHTHLDPHLGLKLLQEGIKCKITPKDVAAQLPPLLVLTYNYFLQCTFFQICKYPCSAGYELAYHMTHFDTILSTRDHLHHASIIKLTCLFVLLLYVPSQQLWSCRDGQFT